MHHIIRPVVVLLAVLIAFPSFGQEERLSRLEAALKEIQEQEQRILSDIEDVKLEMLRTNLHQNGLPALRPGEKVIHHKAMSLVYDEEHEQARWVAHIIHPDIRDGNVGRTNDFRPDPEVATGTAEEQDYFLKYLQDDGSYKYDGFGYDRGHLAPSADFRWSAKALSESYFYSNMSPQVAEFNREKWAELEGLLRGYLFDHPNTQLYVVTGPILKPGLPKVDRSVNGLSIPKLFFKVVLDLSNQEAIGFIMPNEKITAPLGAFAVPIDKVEEETGLDFFYALDDELEAALESQKHYKTWLPPSEQSDVEPLYPPSLPRKHFNTEQAADHVGSGKEVTICGTVVSTHESRKKNIFLNLDKKFPNQNFTITIWKDDRPNFSYEPHQLLMSEQVCVKGQVRDFNGTPSISAEREEQISFYRPNE